jgi:hypothetical protein
MVYGADFYEIFRKIGGSSPLWIKEEGSRRYRSIVFDFRNFSMGIQLWGLGNWDKI